MQQRLKIIDLFYVNRFSVKNVYGILRDIYEQDNRPSETFEKLQRNSLAISKSLKIQS